MLANTLTKLKPEIAAASLGAAVLSIGGPGFPREDDEISNVADKLIAEAVADLNIEGDISGEAAVRLRRYLSEHVDSFIMKGFDRAEISKRLGNRGDLPRGAYTILLGSLVAGKQKQSFVESCIRDADDEQHFMPDGDEKAHKLSLFMKEIVNKSGRRSIVIICATRIDDTLQVDNVYQLLPKLFDLSSMKEPIDYLRAFVDKYGYPIRIGASREAKSFWRNEEVELADEKLTIDTGPNEAKVHHSTLVYGKVIDTTNFLVIVGFGVNDSALQADLAAG